METFKQVIIWVGGLATIATLGFILVQLATAGRGSFLKERNEELAGALEQVRQQRNDDRAEYQKEVGELRDQLNQMRGELASYRREYAKIIAKEVIRVLQDEGVIAHG